MLRVDIQENLIGTTSSDEQSDRRFKFVVVAVIISLLTNGLLLIYSFGPGAISDSDVQNLIYIDSKISGESVTSITSRLRQKRRGALPLTYHLNRSAVVRWLIQDAMNRKSDYSIRNDF